nr:hypothetical protein [Ardenticatena sp.]
MALDETIVPGRPTPPDSFTLPPLPTEANVEMGDALLHLAHRYPPVVTAEFDDKAKAERIVAYVRSLNLSLPDAVRLYDIARVTREQPKLSFWQRLRNALIGPPPVVELPADEIRYKVVVKLDRDEQIADVEAHCREAGALSIQTRPSRSLKV